MVYHLAADTLSVPSAGVIFLWSPQPSRENLLLPRATSPTSSIRACFVRSRPNSPVSDEGDFIEYSTFGIELPSGSSSLTPSGCSTPVLTMDDQWVGQGYRVNRICDDREEEEGGGGGNLVDAMPVSNWMLPSNSDTVAETRSLFAPSVLTIGGHSRPARVVPFRTIRRQSSSYDLSTDALADTTTTTTTIATATTTTIAAAKNTATAAFPLDDNDGDNDNGNDGSSPESKRHTFPSYREVRQKVTSILRRKESVSVSSSVPATSATRSRCPSTFGPLVLASSNATILPNTTSTTTSAAVVSEPNEGGVIKKAIPTKRAAPDVVVGLTRRSTMDKLRAYQRSRKTGAEKPKEYVLSAVAAAAAVAVNATTIANVEANLNANPNANPNTGGAGCDVGGRGEEDEDYELDEVSREAKVIVQNIGKRWAFEELVVELEV